ncbi:hypothetical protein ACN20G_10890 [Streptomyces sp. BI20]|uniref:hypothetical protein n=1 Tax=Streptomyces sp. BI20 TaxID=3403460 RepID=UPI003C70A60F
MTTTSGSEGSRTEPIEPIEPAGTPGVAERGGPGDVGPGGPIAPAPRGSWARRLGALALFAVVAAGVGVTVARVDPASLPGFPVPSDGRWAYPTQVRPEVPPGRPLPFAADNPDGLHHADLAGLLLTPPAGSRPDADLGTDARSRLTRERFLAGLEPTAAGVLGRSLVDERLREIAARGWTMPDGTGMRVHLLRFSASDGGERAHACGENTVVRGARRLEADPDWAPGGEVGAPPLDWLRTVTALREEPAGGPVSVRVGCARAGDVVAVLVERRPGAAVAATPLYQSLILQRQLLD